MNWKEAEQRRGEPGWLPLNRWQGIGTVGAEVQPLYDKRAHESTTTIAAFDLILAGESTSSEEDRLSNRLPCWAHGRLAEPLVLWPRDKGQCLDRLTPGCQVYVEGRLEITRAARMPHSLLWGGMARSCFKAASRSGAAKRSCAAQPAQRSGGKAPQLAAGFFTTYTRPHSSYDASIVLTRVLLLGGPERCPERVEGMTDD